MFSSRRRGLHFVEPDVGAVVPDNVHRQHLRVQSDMARRPHLVGVKSLDDHRQGVEPRQVWSCRRQLVVERQRNAVSGVGSQDKRLDGNPGFEFPLEARSLVLT